MRSNDPSPIADAALDVAMMIDRSGSMQEQCSGGCKRTKHAAIVRSLQDIVSSIGLADVIEIWEFNDDFNQVGSTRDGQSLKAIAKRLNGPNGGMLVRFSTVAGERGSPDMWRDPRDFALKFYTSQGNYDMVGNNTPVFFVRDPMKFPDASQAAGEITTETKLDVENANEKTS